MIIREFNLPLNAGVGTALVINVNQYDSGENWYFTLYEENGMKYTPTTASIVGVKPDGNAIANSATVDENGRVVVEETEQMTACAGRAEFELTVDSTHGTANFILMVEKKPTDEAIPSDSDLSLIQEALDSTNPQAIAQGVSDWMDDNLTPTTPVVDASLTVQGAAADAKKVGDEIDDLNGAISELGAGWTDEQIDMLNEIFNHVMFTDSSADTLINGLITSLKAASGEYIEVNAHTMTIHSLKRTPSVDDDEMTIM